MWRLALKNLFRKKLRSGVTLCGLAVSAGTLFSLLSFQQGYKRGLREELEQLGAHILVVPKGCPYDAASLALHGANWPCFLKAAYLDQVAGTPGVAAAAPVLMSAHYETDKPEICLGVTPVYLQLKPGWKLNGSFPERAGEVMLGAAQAKERNAQLNQRITLTSVPSEKVLVSGILEPVHGPDDDFIFMRLGDAQRWFNHPASLTHILVKLTDPEALDRAVDQLRGCDAGMQMNIVPLTHLFETIRKVVNSTRYLLLALATIALLISATALANTMLMAVLERTREIGVFRASGASAFQVFRLFLSESLVLCVIGAIGGIGLAFGASRVIEGWVRQQLLYAPESTLITLDAGLVLLSGLVTLVIGCVAGVLPACRAASLLPMEAFRTQAKY